MLLYDTRQRAELPGFEVKGFPVLNQGSLRFSAEGNHLTIRIGGDAAARTHWDWRSGQPVDAPAEEGRPANVSADGRYEWKSSPAVVEVLDRTIQPVSVFSQRRKPS